MATVVAAEQDARAEIEASLTKVQTELDSIKIAFGLEGRRRDLRAERDALLDRLLDMGVGR